MEIHPVVLVTDALIFVLLAVCAGFAIYAARREHLRAPWRQVARRPLAMAAAVVLAAFVTVGILDSLHFRERLAGSAQYAPQVVSVLDVVLRPLRAQTEKTYSAPFALHAYAKETVEHADGRHTREYPRLRHGGAHLESVSQRATDIGLRVARGTAVGLAVIAVVLLAYVERARRGRPRAEVWQEFVYGRSEFPARAVFGTAAVLILLGANAVTLAPAYHVLGTDQVGQDVLLRSLKSVRTGIVIGTLTTLVMLPFALVFGIAAGYFRGWIDDAIQYLYTTLSSIPGVLLVAAAVLSLQVYMANHPDVFDTVVARADIRLLFLCLILGVTSWTSLCRLLRAEVLKLREMDYVQAAQALGTSHLGVMRSHLLPNVMHIVLITVVLDFSGLVLAEAVLSYVGVGVDPSMDSWGNMINSARLEMAREPMVWWSLLAAFGFMFALVLAANLFADAVRDALDPRLRR